MRWRAVVGAAASGVVCMGLLTVNVGAHSLLDFDRWMQKIEKRSLSMQRSLKRRDASTAVADAREIQTLYLQMRQYFIERGDSASAVELSAHGEHLAARVVEAAGNDDFDAALQAAITLAKECRDCHADYKPL